MSSRTIIAAVENKRPICAKQDDRQTANVLDQAINGLSRSRPDMSAATGLTTAQAATLIFVAFFLAALGLFNLPAAITIAIAPLSFFFLCIVGLRLAACFLASHGTSDGPLSKASEPSKIDLPVYSILVPVYQEAKMIPGLTTSLMQIDYPAEKLDIKLLIECDDLETRAAAENLNLPPQFQILLIPKSAPRTKPKALNYALQTVEGEFLTIYDAEDRPEADQLKKSIDKFQQSPNDLACLQAKLNFYNGSENWLTRQFTVEYSALFDAFLPALETLKLPLPLGGTSNHFRTHVLHKVGAWDAYNLTEDADLGIRLYRCGYRCAVLNSTTYEEANCRFVSWMKQRTRWLKGWMQTYFVHMRQPIALWRELGSKGFFGFQAVIGGLLMSALAQPIFYSLIICVFWLKEQ